jgi:peroxiredoxin
LQSRLTEIRSLDAEVLAVSVDPPESSREIVEAHGLEFPVLSDQSLAAIDAFGVRHPGGGLEGDIARPALFILDRDGRVVWRDLTDDWRVRVRPGRVLEVLAATP